jgi:hypothetical protein
MYHDQILEVIQAARNKSAQHWYDLADSIPSCDRCLDRNRLVECACGCGEIRTKRNWHGSRREYIYSHVDPNRQWGSNNPNWHGDELTISGTRTRMRKIIKKADINICPLCYSEKRLELVNIVGGYSLDPDDWAYICRKCAITIDGRLEELMNPPSDETRKKLSIAHARRIQSLATRKKISESNKGKHYGKMPEAIKKKISKSMMSEKNPFWHGDKVGVSGIRKRMRKTIQKPSRCQGCGLKKELELANISYEYRLDPNDWEYLCRSCKSTRLNNRAETKQKMNLARTAWWKKQKRKNKP